MKSRIKEQGSALHIVIIIVLVVAVLGLLGFVFWQNFVNKPATTVENTNTPSQSQKESDSKDVVEGSTRTVSINEWGVKGSYSGDEEYVYAIDNYDSVPNFWTLTRSSLIVSCADQPGSVSRGMANEDAIIGSTSSGKTNQEAYDLGYGLARAHVSNYYYFYTGPQADCADSGDTALRAKLVTAMTEVVESLESE